MQLGECAAILLELTRFVPFGVLKTNFMLKCCKRKCSRGKYGEYHAQIAENTHCVSLWRVSESTPGRKARYGSVIYNNMV